MEQEKRLKFIEIIYTLYDKPALINEQWEIVSPLLAELTATSPEGFEGMVSMINTHFTNAVKFKDEKVQKFEIESGLIKLNTYFKKRNQLEC